MTGHTVVSVCLNCVHLFRFHYVYFVSVFFCNASITMCVTPCRDFTVHALTFFFEDNDMTFYHSRLGTAGCVVKSKWLEPPLHTLLL